MKYLSIALICAFFMAGCTYKNETLNLGAYSPQYTGVKAKERKTVFLRVVRDSRVDKSRIGSLLENGRAIAPLLSNTDFENRYHQGILSALKASGFNIDASNHAASMVVEVYIKEINIVHSDKNFDTNLEGVIDIEVVVRKGSDVITQNFKQKGSKWIKPSFESKDLEPFLNELFSDSVDQIARRLATL